MAEATQVQDFKFVAVGRLAAIRTGIIENSQVSGINGTFKTTMVLESDQTNMNGDHRLLVVQAYGAKSDAAEAFHIGDEVKVQGRLRGSETQPDQHGVKHYRTSLTMNTIEKAEGLEHGFTFEASGLVDRQPTLDRVIGKGYVRSAFVLSRSIVQNGKPIQAKIELSSIKDVAVEASHAQVGDLLVARGDINSVQEVDKETDKVRVDAEGNPYYRTFVNTTELINLTPHLDQTVGTTAPAPEAEVNAPAPF